MSAITLTRGTQEPLTRSPTKLDTNSASIHGISTQLKLRHVCVVVKTGCYHVVIPVKQSKHCKNMPKIVSNAMWMQFHADTNCSKIKQIIR